MGRVATAGPEASRSRWPEAMREHRTLRTASLTAEASVSDVACDAMRPPVNEQTWPRRGADGESGDLPARRPLPRRPCTVLHGSATAAALRTIADHVGSTWSQLVARVRVAIVWLAFARPRARRGAQCPRHGGRWPSVETRLVQRATVPTTQKSAACKSHVRVIRPSAIAADAGRQSCRDGLALMERR